MYDVTEFYVQPPTGSAIKCGDREAANAEAERLARRGGQVLLFSVRGTPRYNVWGEPQLIATYGLGA